MPNLDVCGTIYPYPNVGDNPWGVPHIDWATAVSNCLTALNTQVQTQVLLNPFTNPGDLVFANPAVIPTRLPIGAAGTVLTSSGGLPVWQPPASGSVNLPVGAIIAWSDFNGVLTLDPNFRYCDGAVINAPGSLIDGLTTDDLSGAYIVGYGTLGAGDIGTAPYDVTPVGNTNHQIALNHTHTHSHTHTGPSHTHGDGTLKFKIAEAGGTGGGTGFLDMFTSSGTQVTIIESATVSVLPGANVLQLRFDVNGDPTSDFYTVSGSGSTASGGTGNTGGASTANTSSSLSSTQSIQPRSQRYRMIIRVL